MIDILKHCEDCDRIYDKKIMDWVKDDYSDEDYMKITYTCPECFGRISNELKSKGII